jgi:polysaccharide biosynthesis protein PelA
MPVRDGGPQMRLFLKIFLCLCFGVWAMPEVAANTTPAIAFFYGEAPPWDELQAFDLVVVDPDHVPEPTTLTLPHTRLAAYVALGEVHPSRPYAAAIPKAWFKGENQDWASRLVDQSQADWPRFFTDRIITPLWAKGYRTFFLDTLDSYQLFAKTPAARAQQEAGMVAVITAMKQKYPEAKLIFNRGFEILPQVHHHVEMVVAESLFQGYDAGKKAYVDVSEADREWLLTQLRRARDEFHLAAGVIDYLPAGQRQKARDTVKKIEALGLIPWVTTPDLATLGVGSVEVIPRKVLFVHSTLANEYQLRYEPAVRLGSMPLNYMGYATEYTSIADLPLKELSGQFAGVVVWLTAQATKDQTNSLTRWLARQVESGLPIALINPPVSLMSGPLGGTLRMQNVAFKASNANIDIVIQTPEIGFEAPPRPNPAEFFPLTNERAISWLTLSQNGKSQEAVAITPWGGYALPGFSTIDLPGDVGIRWVLNPFSFLKQALRLPDLPVPDTTTESGRRMLMIHMDGDGFVSRSELPGNPIAGEVVLQRVAKKYALPMTISVIEAELSPSGLYPGLSPLAEKTAKEIYSLPNVALASHSYSHPFVWSKVNSSDANEGYNLRIPGYRFDAMREIQGSIRYIESRLAPVGKKVDMFFWTGDCIPGSDALGLTVEAGVMNMNGGDTDTVRSHPTVTQIEGLGIPRKTGFQVFAPNQNENVYTNNWTGPFYGFERVIETFELTESPRRLKPINIYFHTYLTTKAAGMRSLDKVFEFAMAQENTPVYVADYARKVNDFRRLAIAKTNGGWRVRGSGFLRTLRLPAQMGWPDLQQSQGVAGFMKLRDEVFIHLSANTANLVLTDTPPSGPRLVSANGRIEQFQQTTNGPQWAVTAHVPLKFSLANVQNCRVKVQGRTIQARRVNGDTSEFEIPEHATQSIETICTR